MRNKNFQNRIRGWLPKECAASVTPKSADRFPPMVRWTARALVAGTVASAGLLVLGDVAGLTQGVGAYLWPAAVSASIWGIVAAVPLIVKRKINPQRPA